jgi:type IV secretory pathway VirB10-like protein
MKSSLILAGATLALTGAVAVAQSTAKPSPYEGVSQPPASDVIHATEAPAPAPQSATTTAPSLPPPAAAPVKQAPAPAENPDYGIVETPVNTTGGTARTPVLKANPGGAYDPDADIVISVPTPANALAAGTPIHTRLNDQLSSRDNGMGTVFTAMVDKDVVQNGRVIIPTGSTLRGHVIHADYGRRISGHASLQLLADEIVLPDGTRYYMSAVPSLTGHSTKTKVNAEGTIQTRDNPKTLVAQYGVATGAGAATGAILAGPTGAIVGTGIGVGVITAHFLINRQAVDLPAGSSVTFGLTRSMQLTPITTTASNEAALK